MASSPLQFKDFFYYQFYRLGTGGLHRKAEPVGCVTQSQREPIRIKQGRTLLNFKDKIYRNLTVEPHASYVCGMRR